MRKDVRVYLAHVLERLQKIERFTVEGREAFFRSEVITRRRVAQLRGDRRGDQTH
jgi:uncharacterized protein with HEPN domain